MKLTTLLAICVVLTVGIAAAIAQSSSSPASSLVSAGAWSRPELIVPHGIQVRRSIDARSLLSASGPSVIVRFEPIPPSTIQSLQQFAASQQKQLAWTPRTVTGALVRIDVLNDSAPARAFKASPTAADPGVFEVLLPCPSGGWYNQPLRIETLVLADGQEVFSSDSVVTLTP